MIGNDWRPPSGIGGTPGIVSTHSADLIQSFSIEQASRRIARRFALTLPTACAIAELVTIGGRQ